MVGCRAPKSLFIKIDAGLFVIKIETTRCTYHLKIKSLPKGN